MKEVNETRAYRVEKKADYFALSDEDRSRMNNFLRCIREGDDLWLFNSPDAGWELLVRGGERWINLEQTSLANFLLAELSLQYRRLSALLGNPNHNHNLRAIARLDDQAVGNSYDEVISCPTYHRG